MSSFHACGVESCSEIAELNCSCGFYSCRAHLAEHRLSHAESLPPVEQIVFAFSDRELSCMAKSSSLVFQELTSSILQERINAISPLLQQLSEIEKEFKGKLENMNRKQRKVDSILYSIAEAKTIPLRSDSKFLNSIAKIKSKRDISVSNFSKILRKALLKKQSVSKPKLQFEFPKHLNEVLAVAISPCLKKIASADKKIYIWDAHTGQELKQLKGHSNFVQSLMFAKISTYLVSGSLDKTVRIWDVDKPECLATLTDYTRAVLSVAFSPDTGLVASGSDHIKIWRTINWTLKHTLKRHSDFVSSVIFSEDGKLLVSASADKTIKVWDILTANCLHELNGHTDIIWSVAFKNQKIVSGAADKTVKIWNLENEQCEQTFKAHTNNIEAVDISGNLILSVSNDKHIKLFNHEEMLQSFLTPSPVRSACFVGNLVVTGHWDKTARVWSIKNMNSDF